jgi:lipoate-protein ligase A
MGIDEALFQNYNREVPPLFRFYLWDKPTLSLGYFQRSEPFKELKERNDISIVRRMTGGRGVIHHYELTYSMIGGYDHYFAKSDLLTSYYKVAGIFKEAFNVLGIDINVSESEKRSNSPNCFDAPSLYEITLNGHKVIGSAQYRDHEKFLQHGSIIFTIDYDLWSDIYKISAAHLKKSVKGINDLIPNEITVSDVENTVINSLSKIYTTNEYTLSDKEKKLAEKLANEKYSSKEWIFKR